MLYTDIIPYYDDLLSYSVIGARNSENQQHREVASGLEMAIGFKNPTN
jgi:3-deoxy-7-phosphoheptulonate synthase